MLTQTASDLRRHLDTHGSGPRAHIPALDGLRGIAILGVLLFHANLNFDYQTLCGQWYARIAGCGWAGVDLFFVLSGFLVTGILLDTRQSPHFFRNFYMRRTLRISGIC